MQAMVVCQSDIKGWTLVRNGFHSGRHGGPIRGRGDGGPRPFVVDGHRRGGEPCSVSANASDDHVQCHIVKAEGDNHVDRVLAGFHKPLVHWPRRGAVLPDDPVG